MARRYGNKAVSAMEKAISEGRRAREGIAYKRYLIKLGFDGRYYISRDNFGLGSSSTMDEAKKAIDVIAYD